MDLQCFLTYCSIKSSVSLLKPTQTRTSFSIPLSRNAEMKRGKRKQELDTWAVGGSEQQFGWHAGIVTRLLISVIYTVQ